MSSSIHARLMRGLTAAEEVELERHRRVHPEAAAPAAVADLDVEHERLGAAQLVHHDDPQMCQRPVVDVDRVRRGVVDEPAHARSLPASGLRSARRERRAEQRACAARDLGPLVRVRSRASSVASIPVAIVDVLGLDVVADATGGAFARRQPRRQRAEPLAERRHARIVRSAVIRSMKRRRDHRLIDDAVEQVVDRAIRRARCTPRGRRCSPRRRRRRAPCGRGSGGRGSPARRRRAWRPR